MIKRFIVVLGFTLALAACQDDDAPNYQCAPGYSDCQDNYVNNTP